MADKTLIEANRRMLAAQQFPAYKTAQEAIGGRDNVYSATVATNRARKNKITAINNSVSNSMGKMKSDLDLTAYTAEEQKNIRSFLVTQRNKYANAANELARIEDASSPEYQFYVDIMNDVNNSFTNLKGQLDSYKANKVEFAEGVKNGVFSQGNDDSQYAMAATMYGLVDGEKANVPFQIGENGALGFDIGGEFVSYNDFEQPFVKDYKAASGILKQSADLYKNHQTLSGPQKDLLRINLNASLQDPKTIKSLVSDFADEGLDLSDIPLDDMDAARDMIVDRVMNSYTDVAARGKADYDARRAAKAGRGRGTNTNTPGQEPTGDGTSGENYTDDLKGRAVAKIDKMDEFGLPETIKGTKFTPIVIQPIEIGSQEQKDRGMTDEEVKANNQNVGKRIYVYTVNGQQAFKTYDQLVEWAS